ncbi:archaeoflavoprotein AfpA [Thermoproteota archaeon]
MKIAWGVTGSGDKFRETYTVMRELKEKHQDELTIHVYMSKAGILVAKYYKLTDELKRFGKFYVEENANTPFLAGMLQTKRYDLLLIAPATSNTVAKIVVGISDTLLTNAAVQGVKGYTPVYIMPVDYREGTTTTVLPNGKELKLKVRKEDADNVRLLEKMEGFNVFEKPEEIREILEKMLR